MTALAPQVVERGGGVVAYRARKPPEAIVVHLCGYDHGIAVLRCHDPDTALVAVGNAIEAGTVPADLAQRVILDRRIPDGDDTTRIVTAAAVWLRWVPDTYGDPDTAGRWERELRGTIGATPAVLFAYPNPATSHGRPTP